MIRKKSVESGDLFDIVYARFDVSPFLVNNTLQSWVACRKGNIAFQALATELKAKGQITRFEFKNFK